MRFMPMAVASPWVIFGIVIAVAAFDSASDGMAEVKDAAFTFRARVDFYIVGFDGYASLDDFRKDAEDVHVRACFFEEFEEVLVSDAAQFHSFAKSVVEVAAREGFRHGGVDVDGSRLVEHAYEVLAGCDVQGDLSADGASDLREDGCRELDVAHAPVPGGCGKSGDVADDAAAQCDQDVVISKAEVCQRSVDAVDDRKGAGFFRPRHD